MRDFRTYSGVKGASKAREARWFVAGLLGIVLCGSNPTAQAAAEAVSCDRACMTGFVSQLLTSMPTHNPDSLPLASMYAATENSHPAALGMMVAWRTLSKTGKPDLLAIDTKAGQAYFALPVSEGGNATALWGRIKVVDHKIAEIEIYLNRSRGDHGFSFSADQMPKNYAQLMNVPPKRKRASREELEHIARADFDASDPLQLASADDCQFSEVGSKVIDPGLDDEPARPNAEAPLGCIFPPFRPSDPKARTIVIDEELGIIVVAGIVPGTVYPYPFYGHMISAFIPNQMKDAGAAQEKWLTRAQQRQKAALLKPAPATGEVMQLLQYYDDKLHASQINVYLSGPGAQSDWVR